MCLVTTDFSLFVEKSGAHPPLPGTRAPVWVPALGPEPHQLLSAPLHLHLPSPGNTARAAGSLDFSREGVYHQLWLHLGPQSSEATWRHQMGTKCYHRLLARPTELSAHRRYLPNTWMTPHWPSQEGFSSLPSLTSSRPRAHLASRARLQRPFWTLPVKGLSGPIITNFASSRGL